MPERDATPVKYVRVVRDGRSRRLETLVRRLERPEPLSPPVTLAGNCHMGTPDYFAQTQRILDPMALVLYEGILHRHSYLPLDSRAYRPEELTGEQRVFMTEAHQRWLADALVQYQRQHGRYPLTIKELLGALPKGRAGRAAWACVDGWGREQYYKSSGQGFVLSSLGEDGASGGDGAAADILLDSRRHRPWSTLSMQSSIAAALGLVFQFDHINVCQGHWQNCDRNYEQIISHANSVAPGNGAAPTTSPGEQLGRFLNAMTSTSTTTGVVLLHRVIEVAAALLCASPGIRRSLRTLVCEALDECGDIEESTQAQDAARSVADASVTGSPGKPDSVSTDDVMESAIQRALIDYRDAHVVASLRSWIQGPRENAPADSVNPPAAIPASIGVLYGAAHMPGIEAGVRAMGYHVADERWVTALDVAPDDEPSWDPLGRIVESITHRMVSRPADGREDEQHAVRPAGVRLRDSSADS